MNSGKLFLNFYWKDKINLSTINLSIKMFVPQIQSFYDKVSLIRKTRYSTKILAKFKWLKQQTNEIFLCFHHLHFKKTLTIKKVKIYKPK